MAITGPSGSGKTYSALRLAFGLTNNESIAVIDTENGSASLYAHLGNYDVLDIAAPFTVQKYTDAIREAVSAGYDVVAIDSLSHVWAAEGGLLAQKDAKDARGGNSYTNWGEITKMYEQLKSAILQSPIHVIATMRSKQDYVIETDARGKSSPRKVGLAPVQREGFEYEFTTVFDVDMTHTAATSKDRTGLFTDEVSQITEGHGQRIKAWLDGGAEPAAVPAQTYTAVAQPTHDTPVSDERRKKAETACADFLKTLNEEQLEEVGAKVYSYGANDYLELNYTELVKFYNWLKATFVPVAA